MGEMWIFFGGNLNLSLSVKLKFGLDYELITYLI